MEGSDVAAASGIRLRGKESSPTGSLETRRGARARAALGILIVVNAVAFLVASGVHFGIRIPLGFTVLSDVTILPAGIVEGAIGIVFVLAGAAVLARQDWAWNATTAAHLFGILGVLVGLSVTLENPDDTSPVNTLFHLAILPVLVLGLILTLTKSGKRALGRATIPKGVRP
jgi:hypothetical protein